MLHNYLKEVKQNSWRRISQSEIRKIAAAKKERRKRGRAKIPSPQPPSFLPARAEIYQKSSARFS